LRNVLVDEALFDFNLVPPPSISPLFSSPSICLRRTAKLYKRASNCKSVLPYYYYMYYYYYYHLARSRWFI
jgi:hypothetical protein